MAYTSFSHSATATTTTATLTPPSSSHGTRAAWGYPSQSHQEVKMHDDYQDELQMNGASKAPLATHNGNHTSYDPYAEDQYASAKDHGRTGRTASVSDNKRSASATGHVDENSKWIHRDKLAKIESEELQAAGIILPKTRTPSRPRRDRSQDKASLHRRDTDASEQQVPLPTSRKNSIQSDIRTPEVEVPSWDLRLPEEIAEDPGEDYWVQNDSGKGSRIPVAKVSPAPIPVDFLDREGPVSRKASYGTLLDDDQPFTLSKPRSRSGSSHVQDDSPKAQSTKHSATDSSPKKGAQTGARKTSGPSAKPAAPGRPKTRSGSSSNTRSTSTTRPTTRSGELSPGSQRAPEGDPPWMVSAYKPDPRLPPDQQLLPTVAKRLQQEKWEQEGKFGNVYDTEFRPLNEQELLRPPELEKPKEQSQTEESQAEWPLRADAKSPTIGSRPGTSSYSTMPKIQDKPTASPLASPRVHPPPQAIQQNRIQEPFEHAEEKKKEAGCGCCLVM